ncbi:MAG TPA: SusC/RagA family TonB-linked outer membrane protein, partial [Flavisolibacter sp.]|nr:SusC/RagA family TonB-linked outer membrane protein [Flavisolibacter sp.]
VTDNDGHFALLLKGRSNEIVISFVGYESAFAKAGNGPLAITLKSGKNNLSDVVVIGYQNQKRRNVTSAVSTLAGREIKDLPEASFDQMLQGRLAGVNVLSSSGELGAKPNIVIRGATNVDWGNANGGNSGPLYVIDGIIYDVNSIGTAYNAANPITGAVASNNPLSLINPNDIESIDILKDASASAIYGARAGNGVIIVKTKRARSGKPQITFSTFFGASTRPNFRNVLTGTAERRLKLNLLNQYLPYSNLQQGQIPIQVTDSLNPAFNNDVDWQGLMVRDRAFVNSQDISVAGYVGTTSYRLSFNHYKEQGVLNGFSLERMAPHLNLTIRPVGGMSISTDILISSEQRKHGIGGSSGALFSSWNFPSSFPQLSSSQLQAYKGEGNFYDNNKIFAMNASVNLLDTIVRNLTLNSSFSSTTYNDQYDYLSPILINNTENTAYHIQTSNPGWSFENYLTYGRSIKEHHFSISAGTSAYSNRNYFTNAWAKGINISGINTIQTIPSGPNLFVSTTDQRKTTASYYGRLIYDYAGKYLLTASLRRDASSIYSENYRWGTFPSVSLGWIPSEEGFFQPLKSVVNFLKLRVSYGVTGNDPGSWYAKYQNLYSNAGYVSSTTGVLAPWGALYGSPSTYNGTPVISPFPYSTDNLFNANYNVGVSASNSVRWERFPQIDIGGDIELFNGRLNATVDWYQKDAKDKYFYNIPAQVTTGFAYYSANAVDVRNRGLEISLNTHNMSPRSAFQWNTNFNISFNSNYVTKLPNGNRDFLFGPPWFQQTLTIGEPLFNYKVWDIHGVFASDKDVPVDPITGNRLTFFGAPLKAGDAAYVDYNGDYTIDNEDKVIAGNPMPKVTGGFGNTFSYKGLSLNIFCSFITGRNIFNGYLSDYLNGSRDYGAWGMNAGPAAIAGMLNQFWSQPGDHTPFPRLVYPAGTAGQDPWHIASSYFVENGDFLKMKQATLSYNLPDKWIRNMKMKRLNVYGMAENLFTFKRSKVVPDPELVDPTTGSANVVYPSTLKLTLGLNLEF